MATGFLLQGSVNHKISLLLALRFIKWAAEAGKVIHASFCTLSSLLCSVRSGFECARLWAVEDPIRSGATCGIAR